MVTLLLLTKHLGIPFKLYFQPINTQHWAVWLVKSYIVNDALNFTRSYLFRNMHLLQLQSSSFVSQSGKLVVDVDKNNQHTSCSKLLKYQ